MRVRFICMLLTLTMLAGLFGCAEPAVQAEAKMIGGQIVHIVDLSQEADIAADGYLIYVYAYVGDLMTVWINEDTELEDADGQLRWETVLEQGTIGAWFNGEVRPTDTIEDERLPNLHVAQKLTLKAENAEQGGCAE